MRKQQPDPGRHTRVLGTRKTVGGLPGHGYRPAKHHQVRRKKQGPRPLCGSLRSCSAPLQKPPACTDERKTPPFLQRACCPNGETGQTPQNLKTTTETATITSQSEPSTASCEAVSTLIQATIYKGLSRVCFIPSSLTTLFLIPPLSPTRRRRLSWLRDAPRTQI